MQRCVLGGQRTEENRSRFQGQYVKEICGQRNEAYLIYELSIKILNI